MKKFHKKNVPEEASKEEASSARDKPVDAQIADSPKEVVHPQVVVGNTSRGKLGLRFNPHNRWLNLVIGVLATFLVIAGGAYLAASKDLFTRHHTKSAKEFQVLWQEKNCAKGMKELASYNPDTEDVDYSINLLSYKANCYLDDGRAQDALTTLMQLESYYLKSGSAHQIEAKNTASQIKDLQQYIQSQKNKTPVKTAPQGAQHESYL